MSTQLVFYHVKTLAIAVVFGLFALTVQQAHADDAPSATADIIQFGFEPGALQVVPGTTVTWTNHDAIVHSITSGTPDEPTGIFDSGLFDQDGTFSFTFNDAGDYAYYCTRHTFMRGTMSVVAS